MYTYAHCYSSGQSLKNSWRLRSRREKTFSIVYETFWFDFSFLYEYLKEMIVLQ